MSSKYRNTSTFSITTAFAGVLFAASISSPVFAQSAAVLESGKKVFSKCKACHQVGKGAKNRVGPHLNGIFGRPAGSDDTFKYSESMKRAASDGLIWTDATLDAFIEKPKSMISKTKMNFAGLKNGKQREALLMYLRTFSDDPANIPEAEPTAKATDHDIDPTILTIQGDPEYGEYLASECQTCHQSDGSDDGIPAITGWPAEDFVVAMHAYKQKLRPHPVMQMTAGRLSNEEIAALAAYFKGL
jgi:cytochrome c